VVIPPEILLLAIALVLLLLVPARRLQLAGFSGRAIGSYGLILWLLAFLLALRPIGARFLIPILLIAYIAPFVTAPPVLRRVLRRRIVREAVVTRTMKNVTPPDERDDST
jgi:hypothetical protein